MTRMPEALRIVIAVACLAVPTAVHAAGRPAPEAAEDSLAGARDLYAAAAYEDALLVLNRLRAAGAVTAGETPVFEQYRAFCLLALGRAADAEEAMTNIVMADPLYEPSTDVSPRLRTTFADVRRRILPGVLQQAYTAAKADYDLKEYERATRGFRRVLDVLSDPGIAALASQSPLADLKTLATGFHDLSAAAAVPPPPPPPPPAPEPAAPIPPPAVAAAPRIFGMEDTAVVPPIAVKQSLPPFPLRGTLPPHGALEVVIAEDGTVESATMRAALTPAYDRQAVAAARQWRYQPATLNGKPVKYRKIVQITVRP